VKVIDNDEDEKSSGRRAAGNIGLLIPMYVFTVLFVALPILYLFLLSFLQRAQVWGVDFTFTLDNYKRILEPLYLNTFLQSLKLAFTSTLLVALIGYPYGYFMAQMNGGMEAQNVAAYHDPVLDQWVDPPVWLDHRVPQ